MGSYYSIIKTIACGCEQLSDISNALEIKATNLPKYLKVLIDLDIIEGVVPITEDKPEKSKMGLYKIKDNYIRFWFKFVYPYKSYIESEHIDFVLDKIREGFIKNHVAYVYEDICKNQYLPELIIKNTFGFTPTKSVSGGTEKIQKLILSQQIILIISSSANVNIPKSRLMLMCIMICLKRRKSKLE